MIIKSSDAVAANLIVDKTPRSEVCTDGVAYLLPELVKVFECNNIVGQSAVMRQVFDTIMRVSKVDSPVLITGESGTGKELIARAIHMSSHRMARPFVAVSCPNLSDTLLESELFGHERGAFTNATDKKIGRFEIAHGGTIFLDEVSEMGLATQAKFLRVLQEYEFVRVGGTKTISVDVRLIAATNVDIRTAIVRGKFREDLFYRINVIPIDIPPLRERREDIPSLINHYFRRYKRELRSRSRNIQSAAIKLLEDYRWPGNVRELKNLIERVLTLHGDKECILEEHLPPEIRNGNNHNNLCHAAGLTELPEVGSLREAIFSIEKKLIEATLRKANGIQAIAAKNLKITRRILRYKMNKLGIRVDKL